MSQRQAAAYVQPPVTPAAPAARAGHYDEWRALAAGHDPPMADGPSSHWLEFVDQLGPAGWGDLPHALQRARRRVRDDGATYNVYAAAAADAARQWPLELLPFIIGVDDWAQIERGVAQRARLLQATLADLYGEQTLLRDALLPAPLIFGHPQYLRPMRGIEPRGGLWLHLCAFDLARGGDGRWWLIGQRLQAPSGLGYLLENRLVVAPQLREPFAALRVQRLASSFRVLLDTMVHVNPAGVRSRMVLLTPGPANETYFEQVFLARYLGLTLVEGSDLTVRANKLYLKTLHGLERVHAVLRRVDDAYVDPLELNADSALGVPGLLQALRAGEVVLANLPGAGVLESPGLAAFWPAVADRLLGEPLEMPASESWWCGESSVWAAQRARLADYVIAPTFPDSGFGPLRAASLSSGEREALARRIDADPAAYTLAAPVKPSVTPVLVDGRLQQRPAVVRVFALADGRGGWRVLPGGLTRVAGSAEGDHDPWLSMQRGSASIDTWVITRGAVDPSTLLPRPLSADDLSGWHRTVTSRAAENLYWLGRYTERAENAVRLARTTLETLPVADGPVRQLLGELARLQGLVGTAVPTPLQSPRVFERALVRGLVGGDDSQSVAFNLRALKRCAQALRERLSPEHWKLIDEVDARFEEHMGVLLAGERRAQTSAHDVALVLARAAMHLSAITGAHSDHMTRDDGWRLLSVGRQIERLDVLSRTLARGFALRVHEVDEGFDLLLRLFDSLITYRAQFQARREVLPLLHLLVQDLDNPHSLAWVARTMRDRLRKLARGNADWIDAAAAWLPVPDEWPLATLAQPGPDGQWSPLMRTLDECAAAARTLSDEIGRRLFVHVGSPDRRVWQ